jgi:major vault protein
MPPHDQETELVLMPNEFCFYLDKTKGNMNVVVGPYKQSLSQTDQLMQWSDEKKKFVSVDYHNAKRNCIVIPEGWYAPLKNPAAIKEHPPEKAISDQGEAGLQIGKKVNIPGPASFALWPGQMAKVIEGHKLRSNQYLLVRVYDVEAFKSELWYKSLKKSDKDVVSLGDGNEVDGNEEDGSVADENVAARTTDIYGGLVTEKLATGQQFIIKGTDVHFYIPPDGVEVVGVSSVNGTRYVQDAITLEQLQYCILQDESGEKRYVRGPDVVFPLPTEKFIVHKKDDGTMQKKFMAFELNETSGLYVKVIKSYEEDNRLYAEGEELFITGKDTRIYFPRKEHAIIKYGNQDRHFAVALPEGEGRYVLNRIEGGISTVMGPRMFLPDPRNQVIINRGLTDKESRLFFPGNTAVYKYNSDLRKETGDNSATSSLMRNLRRSSKRAMSSPNEMVFSSSVNYSGDVDDSFSTMRTDPGVMGIMGDMFDREGQFVPPRSITLDSKFEGVVSLDIWNGFAVLVTDRNGNRRIVEGPTRVHLEYDETLEVFQLSQNTPKDHVNVKEDVFLRTKNNVVSDKIRVETKDLCQAKVNISMKVDFVGDNAEEKYKWFSVDNYVKLLCERVSSLLKNRIRQMSVMDFYNDSTNIIRDTILGKNEDGKRKGLLFDENNMLVSEVEVLVVELDDIKLSDTLKSSASDALQKALEIERNRRDFDHEKERAEISKAVIDVRIDAEIAKLLLEANKERIRLEKEQEQESLRKQLIVTQRDADKANWMAEIEEISAKTNQRLEREHEETAIQKDLMKAETEKAKAIMEAIQPGLIEALSGLGDNDRIAKLADAIAPQAMFGEQGVKELMEAQFKGLGFGALWEKLGIKGNGVKLLRKKKSLKTDDE